MFAVRLSDRNGSHYHSELFSDLKVAGMFAIRNSKRRDEGAEVIAVTKGSAKGKRVAEFFEGRQIQMDEGEFCEVPVTGTLAAKLSA